MESADPLSADLFTYIASYSRDVLRSDESDNFEPLALRIFAYQYANNIPYRLFCDGRKKTPDSVTRWQEIPAAPAAAFKRFALTCVPPHLCTPEHGGRTFHSSGTTGAETSKHYMGLMGVLLYRYGSRQSYQYFVDPDGKESGLSALMPDSKEAPHSSLSFMLEMLITYHDGAHYWGEDWTRLLVEDYADPNHPPSSWNKEQTVLFGTAFAWVQLLDYMETRNLSITLPEGSRIIETGGFKGRSREVERDELYRMFTDRLGVPATHCVAEYGMSEMASQFYDTTYRDHVQGVIREPRKMGLPHLVRTRVIDPVTGEEAERGQPGVLAHYDIANLNSCLAIQTEDWGYAHPDGDGFVLLGRAPGAALRGCSLTAEEFAARQTGR